MKVVCEVAILRLVDLSSSWPLIYPAPGRLWNKKKIPPAVFQARMAEAVIMFDFSVEVCMLLEGLGLKFVLEHPCSASSWHTTKFLRAYQQLGPESLFSFDQCVLGLRSPDGKSKLRKRTRFWTNAAPVKDLFSCCKCTCDAHMTIQGSQQGVRVSQHAQVYPDLLCEKLVQAAMRL